MGASMMKILPAERKSTKQGNKGLSVIYTPIYNLIYLVYNNLFLLLDFIQLKFRTPLSAITLRIGNKMRDMRSAKAKSEAEKEEKLKNATKGKKGKKGGKNAATEDDGDD